MMKKLPYQYQLRGGMIECYTETKAMHLYVQLHHRTTEDKEEIGTPMNSAPPTEGEE